MKSLSLLMLWVLFAVYKSDLSSSHNIAVLAYCSNSRFDLHSSKSSSSLWPSDRGQQREMMGNGIWCRKNIQPEYESAQNYLRRGGSGQSLMICRRPLRLCDNR